MNTPVPCFVLLLYFGLAVPGASGALGAQANHSAIDSAAVELARGRSWHAARILRGQPDVTEFSPENMLLLAKAESAFGGFRGVAELLRGRSWLPELNGGEGLFLLGMAEFKLGNAVEAARLIGVYEARSQEADLSAVARSWLARIHAENGSFGESLEVLRRMSDESQMLRSWTALEVAHRAADSPNVDAVKKASALALGEPRLRAWALEAEALLLRGDSLAAQEVYRERLGELETPSRRGWALMSMGQIMFDRGEVDAARRAFKGSLDAVGRGASALRASAGLLRTAIDDADVALRVARLLSTGGDARRSVRAYERYFELLDDDPEAVDRFAWARQLSRAGRPEEAVVAFRTLSEVGDPALALRVLDAWMDVRSTQGRHDAVRTIQGWILERFPASPQAAEIHFFQGDALHDRGELSEALLHYRRAMATGPHSIAGLAWMRAGQVLDRLGLAGEAAELYARYLGQYPDGRRWHEAAYWAGRNHAAVGDSLQARRLWESILARFPRSYYGMLAAIELGQGFDLDVPQPLGHPAESPGLLEDLRTLDLIVSADLKDAAQWWIARLRARTRGVGDRMALAERLTEKGFAAQGIRTGQEILSSGVALDRRLLKIIYPFPFRELIMAEAAERDVDPFLLAGLIRQESAFDAAVVSRAGAIGLMQILPTTGAELARAERVGGFTPESLVTPGINVHLGLTFWTDLKRSFRGAHLPLRLSAYNAGPTRARRWGRLPENADPLRFTERIPFAETRGYVKNVSRNAALYRALYGDGISDPAIAPGTRHPHQRD